jgi:membrane-associated protein
LELIQEVFRRLYNVPELIRMGGLIGLVVVVFAETGLMVGFFLPGDSLLVTAGLFAAKGDLDIVGLNLALMAAAIVGDATGYWIGRRAGQALYRRPNSFFFRKQHLVKTHEFYEKHGGKTIVIARFVPIIRTFAPVVAGAAEMTYRRFALYNIAGGIGWVASMTLTGYFLGRAVPDIDQHIHVVVAVVIFLSLLPGIISLARAKLQAAPRADPGA